MRIEISFLHFCWLVTTVEDVGISSHRQQRPPTKTMMNLLSKGGEDCIISATCLVFGCDGTWGGGRWWTEDGHAAKGVMFWQAAQRENLCVEQEKVKYVFPSCHFVPVDGVEYFPQNCWRERYVFMFLCFLKTSLWTPSNRFLQVKYHRLGFRPSLLAEKKRTIPFFPKTWSVRHPKQFMFAGRVSKCVLVLSYLFTYPRRYSNHTSSFVVSYPSTYVGFNTYILNF